MRFRFGEFELDDREARLERAGRDQPVEPKVFALLQLLLRNRRRLIAKEMIVASLWPDTVVGPEALRRLVTQARHAVGDDGRAQRVIETVRGRGLRFVADAEEIPDERDPRPEAFVAPIKRLDRIDRLIAETIDGRGRVVWLSGAAGLGKTRTAEEIASRASSGRRSHYGLGVRGRGDAGLLALDPGAPRHVRWTRRADAAATSRSIRTGALAGRAQAARAPA